MSDPTSSAETSLSVARLRHAAEDGETRPRLVKVDTRDLCEVLALLVALEPCEQQQREAETLSWNKDDIARLIAAKDRWQVRAQRAEAALADRTPVSDGVRPEVAAFAQLMEAQLRANDHKPGWKGEVASDLFPRIAEEADELWEALVRHSKRLSWGDGWVMETDTVERIALEAADVANFAMMIADVCGALPALADRTPVEDGGARIAELEAALKPFARFADGLDDRNDDYQVIIAPTAGNVRNARAALATSREGER